MKKWFLTVSLFGTLCATIPDAKDTFVVQAKDLYNTRTGSSLTTVEFVKLAVKNAVLNELANQKQSVASATATASTQAWVNGINQQQQQTATDLNTVGTGW